ncbi:MAG: hypothetical protein M3Y28_08330 [Armatimonadota bacterium]|nr:hypothetical protein [Armatimonadota bacterium]
MISVKWRRTALLAAALAVVASAPWAQAQRPGAGGRPPGGGMPLGMGKQFQVMRQWGDKHRNLMTLGRTMRGLGELDRDPATKLTVAQAKQILPILKAWRHKPTMTDAQAVKVNHQITSVLKPAQVKKLASRRGPGGGPGGRPPGGFGRPPGGFGRPLGGGPPPGGFGGRPGGGGFGGPPNAPKEYNPLNPDTSPFVRDRARRAKGYDSMMAALAARAK